MARRVSQFLLRSNSMTVSFRILVENEEKVHFSSLRSHNMNMKVEKGQNISCLQVCKPNRWPLCHLHDGIKNHNSSV